MIGIMYLLKLIAKSLLASMTRMIQYYQLKQIPISGLYLGDNGTVRSSFSVQTGVLVINVKETDRTWRQERYHSPITITEVH